MSNTGDDAVAELASELGLLLRNKNPNEMTPTHFPLLKLCAELAEDAAGGDSTLEILHDGTMSGLAALSVKEDRIALRLLLTWENGASTLRARGTSAAASLGVTYDALRRKNSSGLARLDKLVWTLAEATLADKPDLVELWEGRPSDSNLTTDQVTTHQASMATVFMSYSQADDRHEAGFISEMRAGLEGEFRFQTGESLRIFQDRTHIDVGENWQKRLDSEIDGSQFLLVILTPSYLASTACRNELNRFLDREENLGRDDLVLVVYYQQLGPTLIGEDPLAKNLLGRQYADWRELRFEGFESMPVRRELAVFGQAIKAAITRISDEPADHVQVDQDEDDEDGLVELLAQMELAQPRYLHAVNGLSDHIAEVGSLFRAATAELDKGRGSGSAAKKLLVAKSLARDLEPIADQVEDDVKKLDKEMGSIAAGLETLIQNIPTSTEQNIDEMAVGMLDSLWQLHEVMTESSQQASKMEDVLAAIEKQSKTLRPVNRRLKSGTRVIARHTDTYGAIADALSDAIEQSSDPNS